MRGKVSRGAISFQCRSDDERVLNYMKPLSHDDTFQVTGVELLMAKKNPAFKKPADNGKYLHYPPVNSHSHGKSTILMVFTKKDGIFMGYVSFREGIYRVLAPSPG